MYVWGFSAAREGHERHVEAKSGGVHGMYTTLLLKCLPFMDLSATKESEGTCSALSTTPFCPRPSTPSSTRSLVVVKGGRGRQDQIWLIKAASAHCDNWLRDMPSECEERGGRWGNRGRQLTSL